MEDVGLLASQIDLDVENLHALECKIEDVEELPPVDKGWSAWSFLAGTWIVEALFWGEIIPIVSNHSQKD